ncbi:MAG: hypothetical protein G01um10142_546 [Parcubacteria group bacterium Gr01-1014_2]|nr:MAG: hypothetical protein G01um10142_546 [Parcubacteria group bacterium Gr01-1014_2]
MKVKKNQVLVRCSRCKKGYFKYVGHVKENIKLGHNFFCSHECMSNFHKTGKWLECENQLCKKKFYRPSNDILEHNYCSRSCAVKVNNLRYPKWPKRYCVECGAEFKNRDSEYCSLKCGYMQNGKRTLKYTKEEPINLIRKYFKKNNRVPARRNLPLLASCTRYYFGSWNNAVIATGLTPNRSHDHRMYRRIMTKANDGHMCDSVSEAIIDDWLTKNKIPHKRDIPYPDTNHKADWAVKDNIFIEYFGLAKDSPRYDRSIRKKKKLCEKFRIKLIEIYPQDLYPDISLDSKLKALL